MLDGKNTLSLVFFVYCLFFVFAIGAVFKVKTNEVVSGVCGTRGLEEGGQKIFGVRSCKQN